MITEVEVSQKTMSVSYSYVPLTVTYPQILPIINPHHPSDFTDNDFSVLVLLINILVSVSCSKLNSTPSQFLIAHYIFAFD